MKQSLVTLFFCFLSFCVFSQMLENKERIGLLDCKAYILKTDTSVTYNVSCCFQNAEYKYIQDPSCFVTTTLSGIEEWLKSLKLLTDFLEKKQGITVYLGSTSLKVERKSSTVFLYTGKAYTMLGKRDIYNLIEWLEKIKA